MRLRLVAGIACLAACRPQPDGTPEGAYRAFAAAANKGEDAVAFARLTPSSQESLKRRVAGVSAASGGSMGEDAASLVFRGGRGTPVTDIQLLKMEPDRATLAITARGETREVNLLREGSEWRVEFPPLHEEASVGR
jgi:hypothetical protein